jgi:predicted exporter
LPDRAVSGVRRGLLLVGWLVALAGTGGYVARTLELGADLRLFMPAPQTASERLLLEQVGEGPGARLLLVALEGAEPAALAQSSRALRAALAADVRFRLVANGEQALDEIPDALLAYRYLLEPTLDHARFDAAFLREQLGLRLEDLASPAADLLEPWLPRDPTLALLSVAEAWQPPQVPASYEEVWFTPDLTRALLAVETSAAGFDPDGQKAALDALAAQVAATRTQASIRHVVSGPGAFSVLMRERTQDEARWLGTLATIGMLGLLLIAYRSLPALLLAALPLASAALLGLLAVTVAFGTVHGITIAFGLTLIGVAQDYPLHLLSHHRPDRSALATARALWPTLATGVASTCIAYLAFLISGVAGLAQLAVFTIAGLAVAGLSTRYLLPRLLGPATRDYGDSPRLGRWWRAIATLPRPPRWLGLLLVGACLAWLAFAPVPMWENNLAALTPLPKPLLERDLELRRALGAPDVRHLLVLEGISAEQVLAREEATLPDLERLRAAGAIGGYDLAARYLPSAATQQRRRDALPEPAALRAALADALAGMPFQPGVFEPFVADVERARALPALTAADLEGTPLAARVGALLFERGGRWTGLVALAQIRDTEALRRWARTHGDLHLLDLKSASEGLVARYRERILWSLAGAALLLTLVVALALRRAARVRRVLAPMALTTLLLLTALHGAGVPLNLFHLIALVLAAGLGLDYALFFEHAADDPTEQRRTLHAVLVCASSTLMVFALLAASSQPVLRAIGVTVSLGVLLNFALALLLTRPGAEPAR